MTRKPGMRKVRSTKTAAGQCLCGCGGRPKGSGSNYVPGHDARLVGYFARVIDRRARPDEMAAVRRVVGHPAVTGSVKLGPLATKVKRLLGRKRSAA